MRKRLKRIRRRCGDFTPASRRAIHSRSFGVRIGMDLVEVWERARGGMAGGWGWARETYIAEGGAVEPSKKV